MKLIKLSLIWLMFLYLPSSFFADDIRIYMSGSLSVSENFAIAMTRDDLLIGAFNIPAPSGHRTSLSSGEILEYQSDYLPTLISQMVDRWFMNELVKGDASAAYFIRMSLLLMEGKPLQALITPPNSRWIYILKKIHEDELMVSSSYFSEAETFIFANMYYNLNFDATGAVCLHWPEESQFTPQDYVVFSTDEAVDDLKAIAAVYTPENGGENIQAGDITTLENALETDFGRSVLTELLQLHGDPREE